MLLTIRSTHIPADDLGYLLHKNPARTQSFELSFGRVHVFYPELSDEACTAALLLDVDPVGLVRRRRGPAGEGGALEQYVNDRPYVASSFLSVAIAQVLRSAMAGTRRSARSSPRRRFRFRPRSPSCLAMGARRSSGGSSSRSATPCRRRRTPFPISRSGATAGTIR